MRRMLHATLSMWSRAWPYLEFLLRARRVDAVVAREMVFIDRLRYAHFWTITRRIEDEQRIRGGRTADWAADQAFALSTPTVYEELAVQRSRTTEEVIDAVTIAVLAVILEPGTRAVTEPPPDWQSLEVEAEARARDLGADFGRLTPEWLSAGRPAAPSSS